MIGGYDDYKINFGTDYIFWLKFASHYKPKIINQVFSYIRYDNTTKTGTFDVSRYIVFLKKMKKFSKNKFYRSLQYIFIFLIIITNYTTKKLLK